MPTVWPPQGEASFEFKMPCCECAAECWFTIGPYDDEAAAAAAIAADVEICKVYFDPVSAVGTLLSRSASAGTGIITITESRENTAYAEVNDNISFGFYALAAGTAIFDHIITGGGATNSAVVTLSDDDGIIDSQIVYNLGQIVFAVPQEGCYYVSIFWTVNSGMDPSVIGTVQFQLHLPAGWDFSPLRASYGSPVSYLVCV